MLHPQAAALLALMEERRVPPVHTLAPGQARAMYLARRSFTQPAPEPVGEVRDLVADGGAVPVPLRLYRPVAGRTADALLPVLVYCHGGGWVIGDLDTHDSLCRQLAVRSGCAVLAVDYRLAPEHVFPAAVDDTLVALRWVRRQAAALGLDAARIAIGGDSAGGNLAAVAALATRGTPDAPVFQLLIYPATDQRRGHDSHVRNGQGYLLTADSMAWYAGHYLPDPATHTDWRASPLLADELSGLPPALVLTAGFDPLRDEGVAYAQRLSEAGVRATLLSFERQIHGFITMGRVIDEADAAVSLCAAALREALNA